MYTLNAQEAICYCRAGITRSGNENIYLFLTLHSDEILQESCHETCTNILEGKGGTMKEFQ